MPSEVSRAQNLSLLGVNTKHFVPPFKEKLKNIKDNVVHMFTWDFGE